jgi:hypothetical protein
MDRVASWYKRKTQLVLFFLSTRSRLAGHCVQAWRFVLMRSLPRINMPATRTPSQRKMHPVTWLPYGCSPCKFMLARSTIKPPANEATSMTGD